MIDCLLEAGAKPGPRALLEAVKNGHCHAVHQLLDVADAELLSTADSMALPLAVTGTKRREMVDLLLERGASIDAKDPDGNTALVVPGQEGYISLAQQLLGRGASVHMAYSHGNTIPHKAVSCKHHRASYLI